MSPRKRVLLLIVIMVLLVASTTIVSIGILYKTAIKEGTIRLSEIAKSQARLIEAVAGFDQIYSNDYPFGSRQATLSQIREAHSKYQGFGDTGEFTLAEKTDDQIVFLLSHRHFDLNNPKPVPWNSTFAEPMRLALSGKSGVIIGLDYRGEKVLAAHEPVEMLNLGIVAKIDLSEIRAPFVKAVLITGLLSTVLIIFGVTIFLKVTNAILKELQKSEEKHRNIVENATNLFYSHTADNVLTYISPQSRDFLQCEPEEAMVRWTEFLTDNPANETGLGLTQKAIETGKPQPPYELELIGKKGKKIIVEVNEKPVVEHNETIGIVGSLTDITDRKRAEEALRQREAQLASLGDNIPGGMTYQVELDAEGKTRKFVYVSAGVEKMHEVTADAVIKDAGVLYGQIAEDQLSFFMEKEIEAFKEMRNFSVEACFRLPSGKTRWGMLSSAPRRSPNGNILWDGIEIDITKRKKAEKDRELLQDRLLKSQRMESIATLAGGIAHQFNNALTAVTGNIELLEMNLRDHTQITHYVAEIKTSAIRMAELTAQLLTYARGGKYQAKKISLSDFVRDTLPSVRHTIDPGIHIATNLVDDIFNIEADLTQLKMVLSAVLLNASEAMAGKGHIRIDCRNEIITEHLAERHPGFSPGNYACMTIADDGQGMEKETRDRVLEPFFTTKFQGRGLGMAGVYGFVKSHDGYIMVDSELGEGTIVNIYLPACESPGKD